MKRYGLYAGFILLIAVNTLVLAGVWCNRSGTPDAVVELTSRELILGRIDRENSGVSLRINWRRYDDEGLQWFDRDKLAAVGFDCGTPVGAADAYLRYAKALPRKTFVVLEFEGKAWEAWQARKRKRLENMEAEVSKGVTGSKELSEAKKRFARELVAASRLFPVDVGNDPKRLREIYTDRARFIITPARVRLSYHMAVREKGKITAPARLSGSVEEVLTDTVRVPRDKQGLLRSLIRRVDHWRYRVYDEASDVKLEPPRYGVVLKYGRRYEPWVEMVRPYQR
jgi:hypothetical protein